MKLNLKRIGTPYLLEGVDEHGNKITFDASPKIGGANQAFGPMAGVAVCLAACSSIDVLMILMKKKHEVENYEVEVDANRVEEVPAVFDKIHLTFKLKGAPLKDVERAADLSVNKYCSVAKMLRQAVEITYSIEFIE